MNGFLIKLVDPTWSPIANRNVYCSTNFYPLDEIPNYVDEGTEPCWFTVAGSIEEGKYAGLGRHPVFSNWKKAVEAWNDLPMNKS